MKILVRLLLLVVLLGYLIFAFVTSREVKDTAVCQDMEVVILDSMHVSFITPLEVVEILKKNKIYPIGEQFYKINTKKIENVLLMNESIDSVECYLSADKTVRVVLQQRLPLLRIITYDGVSYYIDHAGKEMRGMDYAADLPVVTGNVTNDVVKKYMVPLGKYIEKHSFWNNQIEQIRVLPDTTVVMFPRVGNQQIILGLADSLNTKFENLKAFYLQVAPKVGWNKYEELDLTYPNQVIGRKKEHCKKTIR